MARGADQSGLEPRYFDFKTTRSTRFKILYGDNAMSPEEAKLRSSRTIATTEDKDKRKNFKGHDRRDQTPSY